MYSLPEFAFCMFCDAFNDYCVTKQWHGVIRRTDCRIYIEDNNGIFQVVISKENKFELEYDLNNIPEQELLQFIIHLNKIDLLGKIIKELFSDFPEAPRPYEIKIRKTFFFIVGYLQVGGAVNRYKLNVKFKSYKRARIYYIHCIVASKFTKRRASLLYENFTYWFNNQLQWLPTPSSPKLLLNPPKIRRTTREDYQKLKK